MAKPLDVDERRLRGLSPAQLADEVGMLKAEIAAADEKLARIRDEAVRRKLASFDSELFHCTLSPPGEQRRLDKTILEAVFGAAFIAHFTRVSETGWSLRCFGRSASAAG
jgi:hypothetical protein